MYNFYSSIYNQKKIRCIKNLLYKKINNKKILYDSCVKDARNPNPDD